MRRRTKVVEGSDNVFADIGLPNPEEALAKADVARQIIRIISERQFTQSEAGNILGIGQPRVSQLKRGRLSDFSLEKLIEFAKTLGNSVEILVKPAPEPRLSVRVGASATLSSGSTNTYIHRGAVGQISTGAHAVTSDAIGRAIVDALDKEGLYWSRIQPEPTNTRLELPLASDGTIQAHLAWILLRREQLPQ